MTSNEERQKVAARLRDFGEDGSPAKYIYGGTESYDQMLVRVLRQIVGRGDLFERLADLIDRPTCVMDDLGNFTPHHDFKRMACSKCGAMHWEQPQETLRMRYCPWCGREVVEDA